MPDKSKALLADYLPAGTVDSVWDMIRHYQVRFRIARPRKSKLGDYRPPNGKQGHRISVNSDLNPYAFLITTLHEFAHLVTWNSYKNRVLPHGMEWKVAFREILTPYINSSIFPEEIIVALRAYMNNPAASSCTDLNLHRTLRRFDQNATVLLETLPHGAHFKLQNGMVFEKGKLGRTRYRCQCLTNGKWYFVSAVAEVHQLPVQQRLF